MEEKETVFIFRMETGIRLVLVEQHVRAGQLQGVREAAASLDPVGAGQHAAAAAERAPTGRQQRRHQLRLHGILVHAFCG